LTANEIEKENDDDDCGRADLLRDERNALPLPTVLPLQAGEGATYAENPGNEEDKENP